MGVLGVVSRPPCDTIVEIFSSQMKDINSDNRQQSKRNGTKRACEMGRADDTLKYIFNVDVGKYVSVWVSCPSHRPF